MPSVEDFIVDFSKEEEGGGGQVHVKPATYLVRIVGAKTGISENKGSKYMEVIFAFKEGSYAKRKKKISERLYISPKAMRRFRLLLQAVGLKVPAKFDVVKIIPKLKGKELYIEIEDEAPREGYEDRGPRSRVAFDGFISVDDYNPDEDEDEEDLEDEEDEELEDEDDEDLEEEEEDEDEEEEERPRSKRSSKSSSRRSASSRKRKRPEPDEDEDEEDEDEDEDEEPPARKRSAKKKAPAKKSRSRKAKDEDDEDEDLDELDLDDM